MPARAAASADLALSVGASFGNGFLPGRRSQASLILRLGPGCSRVLQPGNVIIRQQASAGANLRDRIVVFLLPLVDLSFGLLELAGEAIAVSLGRLVCGLEGGHLALVGSLVLVVAPVPAEKDAEPEQDRA